jgi:hypothetical protein
MKKLLVLLFCILSLSGYGQVLLNPGKGRNGSGGDGLGTAMRVTNQNFQSVYSQLAAPDLLTVTPEVNGVSMAGIYTIQKGIALLGYAVGYDFYLPVAAANHTAYNLDLGAIIPARSKVLDIQIVASNDFVNSAGASDITIAAGNASAGAQFIVAASCDTQNEVVGVINPALPVAVVMSYTAATKVWLSFDPDQNWATTTNGEWRVYITYITY